tara:strand:+ start:2710 stop:3435 length:726 start_codon:yes stop_codon:yes gene_type:complete
MATLSKAQIQSEIERIVKAEVRNYFRMARPGFEIVSNHLSELYGVSEYVLNTDEAQGMGFYKNGTGKMHSNKSFEIISGESTHTKDDNSVAVGVYAKNGNVHIKADNGDIILEGKNIKMWAHGEENDDRGIFQIEANKEFKLDTPTIKLTAADALQMFGKSNVTMLGGNVSIFARESDVEISDGTNLTLGPDSVPEFIDRIEAFAAYWDEEVMAYAEDTGRSIEDAQTLLSGGSIETVIGG